jgi:hypothetical protein
MESATSPLQGEVKKPIRAGRAAVGLTLTRRFADPAAQHLPSVSAAHEAAPEPRSAATIKPAEALQTDFRIGRKKRNDHPL